MRLEYDLGFSISGKAYFCTCLCCHGFYSSPQLCCKASQPDQREQKGFLFHLYFGDVNRVCGINERKSVVRIVDIVYQSPLQKNELGDNGVRCAKI
jgi:hypothetical protein